MANTSNIEVVGTLYQLEEPVQTQHQNVSAKENYVAKEVYYGKLLQTNEVPTSNLLVLGILILSVVYTLKKIHGLSSK